MRTHLLFFFFFFFFFFFLFFFLFFSFFVFSFVFASSFTVPLFSQTQDLILPVALNGYTAPPVHYQTIVRIVNMSATSVDVTLEAYQNDGTPVRILELFPVARPGTKTVLTIGSGGAAGAFTAGDVDRESTCLNS